MEVRRYHGNILSSIAEVIAHQANCLGKMDAGIDQEIRDKCPEAFPPYAAACRKGNMLDECQMVKTKSGLYIANLFGQYGAKTDYTALKGALKSLLVQMQEMRLHTVAFPYCMGAGQNRGEWTYIYSLIHDTFARMGVVIEIWAENGF